MPSALLTASPLAYGGGVVAIVGTLAAVAIGRLPGTKMNRATIAFTGAVLLVVLGSLTLDQAFAAVELGTIGLLLALMAVNVALHESGFFRIVTALIVRRAGSPKVLLAGVIIASGFLSALFLNDTICVMFTPLVVDVALALRRNPIPYLMGLATASNIGSTATITGNPQNILIGISSGISFVDFAAALGPIAIVGLALAFVVIVIVYRSEFRDKKFDAAAEIPGATDRPLMIHALFATAVMLGASILGASVPLAALAAGAIIFVNRRIAADRLLAGIDWSLLVFFAGLFVVTGAVDRLGLSTELFSWAEPVARRGIVPLTLVGVGLSNVVSNVPAVMLFRPIVPNFPDPRATWLALAMSTTLAGNLTLIGSVANLIVAEIAARRGVKLGFVEYLKSGVVITAVTLAFGAFWLGFVRG